MLTPTRGQKVVLAGVQFPVPVEVEPGKSRADMPAADAPTGERVPFLSASISTKAGIAAKAGCVLVQQKTDSNAVQSIPIFPGTANLLRLQADTAPFPRLLG